MSDCESVCAMKFVRLHLAKLDFRCLYEVMMLGVLYYCRGEISYECDLLIGCQSFFFFLVLYFLCWLDRNEIFFKLIADLGFEY